MSDLKFFKSGIIAFIGLFFMILYALGEKAEATSVELKDGSRVDGVKNIEKKQPDSELTILGLTVGVSKLSEVKEKLKGGEIHHEGDAGSSVYVLCYEGTDGTVLAFESSEMGGSERMITSAGLFGSNATYRFAPKCSKSSMITRALELGGIHLGISKAAVKKLKGKVSKELSKVFLYQYQTIEKTAKGQSDISSSLEIGFDGNKASYFIASKIESY